MRKSYSMAVLLAGLSLSICLHAQRVMSTMEHIVVAESLSGRVKSVATDLPIEGVTVTEYAPGSQNQIATVKTDKDGHFEFAAPSFTGMPYLTFSATDMMPTFVRVHINSKSKNHLRISLLPKPQAGS